MSSETYELNCPYCDKLYKLPRDKVIKHAGKSIHCRKCGKPFSIPTLPPDEPEEIAPPEIQFAQEETSPAEPVAAPEPEQTVEKPGPVEPVHEESPAPESPAPDFSFQTPFATGEALEPPPLSEYADAPNNEASDEAPAESPIENPPEHVPEQFEESFAGPISETLEAPLGQTPLIEPPEPSSYFASESVAEASVRMEDTEPEPIAVSEPEPPAERTFIDTPAMIQSEPAPESGPLDSFHGFALSDESAKTTELAPEPFEAPPIEAQSIEAPSIHESPTEVRSIEAPPPQLPPVPVSSPPLPKPRRGARAAVAPVFDAQAEEPQPRRRGLFGSRAEPDEPIETVPTPPVRVVAATVIPPVIEEPHHEETIEREPVVTTEPLTEMETEAADVVLSPTPKEETPILVSTGASTRMPSSPASSQSLEDMSALRRSVTLLATMSVIIAIVLIAILLTLLGIIPKK